MALKRKGDFVHVNVIAGIVDLTKKFLFKNSPFAVQYQVTSRCNIHCKFCTVVENIAKYRELTVKEMEPVARNLGRIRTSSVILTGGEPFIRNDLPEIITLFKRYVSFVRVQSNSLLINEQNLKAVIEAGLDGLSISLDTLNENIEDEIIGRKGSWKTIIEKIALVNRLMPFNLGSLCFNSVVTSQTYKGIVNVVKLAEFLGWTIFVIPLHMDIVKDSQFRARCVNDPEEYSADLKKAMAEEFLRLAVMKKSYVALWNSASYFKNAARFIIEGKMEWRHRRSHDDFVCDSPNLYFVVLPNGDYSICTDFRFNEIINVGDDEFVTQFSNGTLRKKVEKVSSKCAGCYYPCYPQYTCDFYRLSSFIKMTASIARILFKKRRTDISVSEIFAFIDRLNSGEK